MLSTLRERKPGLTPLAVWALATVISTVAGPFGTLEALGPGARLLYWAGVAAVSVAGCLLVLRLAQSCRAGWRWTVWGFYVVMLAAFVHGLNMALFDFWQGWSQFFYLLGIVAVTFAVVQGMVALLGRARPVPEPTVDIADPQALFLRRIPLEKRAALLRLEAQDHYLNVVTENGQALILMRLQDAIDALQGAHGLRVHRSHWVMVPAVQSHHRDRGRDFLTLKNGDTVPVSRSFRSEVQAAGLI